MKKSALYTKTGDKGETSLLGGERVLKSDVRLSLYGQVDELNSFIGLVVSTLPAQIMEGLDLFLLDIQSDLFALGSNLAAVSSKREAFKLRAFNEADIEKIEKWIDLLDDLTGPLKNFILPGGSPCACHAHISRSFCRRVEREYSGLAEALPEESPTLGLRYLNRLSDFLFALARYINKVSNKEEIIWKG